MGGTSSQEFQKRETICAHTKGPCYQQLNSADVTQEKLPQRHVLEMIVTCLSHQDFLFHFMAVLV